MKVIKTTLPAQSVLAGNKKKYDYIDSFEGSYFDRKNNITSAQIGKAFFSSSPAWVDKLFAWRNKIVSLLGLKTSGQPLNRQELLAKFHCEPHEQMGLFKVFERTDHEVVLGEDDKHLNFRVSLFKSDIGDSNQKKLTISTTVAFNNRFGKIYFFLIKPFHALIVPTILKGIIKTLEDETP
jgi:hypothetical protein